MIPLSVPTNPTPGSTGLAPDLAYEHLVFVNVVFVGPAGAGDRGWVLVDADLFGTKILITDAAAKRFGDGAHPAAILMTHGHFDHVGVLEDLARSMRIRSKLLI